MKPRFLTLGDITAAMSRVDDIDAQEQARNDRALAVALRWCRPPNWWGTGIPVEDLIRIAKEDGIPTAWLPDSDVLMELTQAPTPDSRLQIILDQRDRVIRSCQRLLTECQDPRLAGVLPLCERVIDAFAAGFHEPAMALSVSIAEPLAIHRTERRFRLFDSKQEYEQWEKEKKKARLYEWVRKEAERPSQDSWFAELEEAVLGPVPRFFTPWYPDSGEAKPTQLSRHVVAHQPDSSHFTAQNSLLSLMLMTSLMRDSQEWLQDILPED